MNKGKQLISDLKFYEAYSKYKEDVGRKENWNESVEDVMRLHRNKFRDIEDLTPFLDFVEKAYSEKKILASQRNLQYREAQIVRSNARLYNCCSTYIDRPEVFKQLMFVLLNGCGAGYSVEQRYIDKLPQLYERQETINLHQIEDSIEGWSDALDALMMSYFNGSEKVHFDYSLIRPEGAFISGGFKAPGHEPLKRALEFIESMIEAKLRRGDNFLTSLDAHEIICLSSDAVLSAGVRRSAIICLFDKNDELMLNCKTGDWFYSKPHLARANNSIKLVKGTFTKEEFDALKKKIQEFGEPGIVLVDDERFCTNPCAEIGFIPINPRNGKSAISFCNLNEINGGLCKTEEAFYKACEAAAILGTLQASYTDFAYLGSDTEELVRAEALIGVSITGFMDNPEILFNPEILQEGARIVKETNATIAQMIGINPAARCTTVKPSGNASVLLGTTSGIHPDHARRYFRIMQLNKNTEIGKFLSEHNECLLEESVWSASKTDYAVYIPIETNANTITKEDLNDIAFIEKVRLVYQNWVVPGTNFDLGYSRYITHNVSNTITVNDWDAVFDYIFEHQDAFCGLSFIPAVGDKIYKQAPFTKVMDFEEITKTYGEAALFASGLVVDALHDFDNDLWDACQAVVDTKFKLSGDRYAVLLKKDIIRRIKQFSKNFFKGDIEKTVTCLKDVYLFHKWVSITRKFRKIDFEQIDLKPTYTSVSDMGATACAGGACEITRF